MATTRCRRREFAPGALAGQARVSLEWRGDPGWRGLRTFERISAKDLWAQARASIRRVARSLAALALLGGAEAPSDAGTHYVGCGVLVCPPRRSGPAHPPARPSEPLAQRPGSIVRIVLRNAASETLKCGTAQSRKARNSCWRTDPVKNERTLWREREAPKKDWQDWLCCSVGGRHPAEAS